MATNQRNKSAEGSVNEGKIHNDYMTGCYATKEKDKRTQRKTHKCSFSLNKIPKKENIQNVYKTGSDCYATKEKNKRTMQNPTNAP